MQGKQIMNAGSSGKFHYSNRINPNTRYTNPNRDWRLSQMLGDWETQQEMRKKEEAMKEKAKERKEFTKDIAKLIKGSKKKRKKRTSTSSESSTSRGESTPELTPETSPEVNSRKSKKKRKNFHKKEIHSVPLEIEEINRTLMDLRTTNEKIHKEIMEMKKHQTGTTATIERMEFEINTVISDREKFNHRLNKLEIHSGPRKEENKVNQKSDTIKEPIHLSSDESETELNDKEKGKLEDDKTFDLALKFGIATCMKKSDLEKKFEKRTGTARLKEFCEEVNIKYITKNKAITDVWQLLLDNKITR